MTPVRSLAASVVALGFAGTLTAPLPAFAAPAPCERAENYAAQSGAELLRIDRLELHSTGLERPVVKSGTSATHADPSDSVREDDVPGATDRLLVPDPPADSPDPGASTDNGAGGLGDVLPGSDDAPAADADTDSSGSDDGSVVDGVVDITNGGYLDTRAPLGSPSMVTSSERVVDGGLRSEGRDGTSVGDREIALGMGSGNVIGSRRTTRDATGSRVAAGSPVRASGASGRQSDVSDVPASAVGAQTGSGSGSGSRSDGGNAVLAGVGLGEAKTALVANAQVNSAAVARMVNGQASGKASLTGPLVQQAPPGNDRPAERRIPAGRVGPITIGAGELDAHARWDARMACGNTAGEAASAAASLNRVDILPGADGALVRVPEKISSRSTTALERRGNDPRAVASATVAAGRLSLAGGRVRVRMLRAPMLTASIGTGSGGEIRYQPAIVEVSGPDIKTKRLETVGDGIEVPLGDDSGRAESTSLSALSALDGVRSGLPLPLPTVPGLPSLGTPETESAPAVGAGSKVRISLGDVRQATKGNAIAARATAIKIAITHGSVTDGRSRPGYGGKAHGGVVAEVGFGLLEAAAVAPDSQTRAVAGAAGGLPITGPRVGLLAMGGLVLLVAGGMAVFLGVRRRRAAL